MATPRVPCPFSAPRNRRGRRPNAAGRRAFRRGPQGSVPVCEFQMLPTMGDFVVPTYRTYRPRFLIPVRRPPIVSTVADRGPLTSPTRTPLGFVTCAPSRGRWTGNTKPRRWHPPSWHASSYRSGTTEIDGAHMNRFFMLRGRLDNGP